MKKILICLLILFAITNIAKADELFGGYRGVYAYANMKNSWIRIKIINFSNMPVEFNYFADTYYLITEDKQIYSCNKDLSDYNSDTLNPNDYRVISVSCYGFPETKKKILAITIDMGNIIIPLISASHKEIVDFLKEENWTDRTIDMILNR